MDALIPPFSLDSADVYGSIGMLPDQIRHAWESVSPISIPDSYQDVDRLVVFGMGGSALGIDVIQHLYAEQLTIPVSIVNDYHVPGFVNERTLVILSSYSGSTEEVVTAAHDVLSRGAKTLVIASGKDLVTLAQEHSLPLYKIDPVHNPCNQPRIAVGYSIVGQMAFLGRLGFIPFSGDDVERIAQHLERMKPLYLANEQNQEQNIALRVAHAICDEGRIPVIVSSQHLRGVAHVFRNQINENGKHLALMREIPEMNHHAMEGLEFPEAAKQLVFILCESDAYHERNSKRYEVLTTILEKMNLPYERIQFQGTKMEQAFSMLLMGGYCSFYVSMLNTVDPAPIPWVDLFKEELGNPS